MALPTSPEGAGTSTRPYLIRALHEWCRDNGYTPYIAVHVDASVRVPPEYVKNREIVLNVGFDATNGLVIGNDFIEFKARFGGSPREIVVPVSHVIAIYARENGQGMAFPAPSDTAVAPAPATAEAPGTAPADASHLALAPTQAPAPAPAAPPRTSPRSAPPAAPAGEGPPRVLPVPPSRAGLPAGRRSSASSRPRRGEAPSYTSRPASLPVGRRRGTDAGLAQLAEHPPCKRKVPSSIPGAGTSASSRADGRRRGLHAAASPLRRPRRAQRPTTFTRSARTGHPPWRSAASISGWRWRSFAATAAFAASSDQPSSSSGPGVTCGCSCGGSTPRTAS